MKATHYVITASDGDFDNLTIEMHLIPGPHRADPLAGLEPRECRTMRNGATVQLIARADGASRAEEIMHSEAAARAPHGNPGCRDRNAFGRRFSFVSGLPRRMVHVRTDFAVCKPGGLTPIEDDTARLVLPGFFAATRPRVPGLKDTHFTPSDRWSIQAQRSASALVAQTRIALAEDGWYVDTTTLLSASLRWLTGPIPVRLLPYRGMRMLAMYASSDHEVDGPRISGRAGHVDEAAELVRYSEGRWLDRHNRVLEPRGEVFYTSDIDDPDSETRRRIPMVDQQGKTRYYAEPYLVAR